MRLDEWQKWIDQQFLDNQQKLKDEEEQKAPVPAPDSAMVESANIKSQAPGGARTDSATTTVTESRTPPQSKQIYADDNREALPNAKGLEEVFTVPSIENYFPALRKAHAEAIQNDSKTPIQSDHSVASTQESQSEAAIEEPVPAAALDIVSQQPETALPNEQIVVVDEPVLTHNQEEVMGLEAPVSSELVKAAIEEKTISSSVKSATTTNKASSGVKPSLIIEEPVSVVEEAQTTPRRYGVSHRRARHARNVHPENAEMLLNNGDFWALTPRHMQALISMGNDETAKGSYKREFRETRIELIKRLLDPTLSLEDTARLLNVCPTTVRRYTNRGLLTHQRTSGDQRRFKLSDVLAFLEAQSRR